MFGSKNTPEQDSIDYKPLEERQLTTNITEQFLRQCELNDKERRNVVKQHAKDIENTYSVVTTVKEGDYGGLDLVAFLSHGVDVDAVSRALQNVQNDLMREYYD